MADNIQSIRAIFPDIPASVVQKFLTKHNNNMDQTVEALLNAKPEELKEEQQQEKLVDDEEFAKQLQRQLDLEDKKNRDEIQKKDEDLIRKMTENPSLDSDEEYARRLMAEELQKMNRYNPPPPPNTYTPFSMGPTPESAHLGYSGNFSSPSVQPMKIEDLDETVINELLSSVKKSIIPVIKEGLGEVEIPDIDETVETGKVGKIQFSVSGVGIDKVTIPEDKMKISLHPESKEAALKLEMLDIAASLKEFNWSYSKDSFPKLKDSGKARAGISKVNIVATMGFGIGRQGPEMKINDVNVTVGELELKLSGTAASMLYNVIITFFKGIIKKQIENSLQEMVSSGLGNNSIDLLSAFGDVDDDE